MKTTFFNPGIVLVIVALTFVQQRADAQAFTEIRDPLRGVTLYSAQISSDPLTSLQVEGSVFSSSDQMTLGFSAFFFDESDSVDEYVLWLRHDGPRRWFSSSQERPLKLFLDELTLALAPQHNTQSGTQATSGPLVEKKEFELVPNDFRALLAASEITIELTTSLGVVEKVLSETERAAIARFDEIVRRRHSELLTSVNPAGR